MIYFDMKNVLSKVAGWHECQRTYNEWFSWFIWLVIVDFPLLTFQWVSCVENTHVENTHFPCLEQAIINLEHIPKFMIFHAVFIFSNTTTCAMSWQHVPCRLL